MWYGGILWTPSGCVSKWGIDSPLYGNFNGQFNDQPVQFSQRSEYTSEYDSWYAWKLHEYHWISIEIPIIRMLPHLHWVHPPTISSDKAVAAKLPTSVKRQVGFHRKPGGKTMRSACCLELGTDLGGTEGIFILIKGWRNPIDGDMTIIDYHWFLGKSPWLILASCFRRNLHTLYAQYIITIYYNIILRWSVATDW